MKTSDFNDWRIQITRATLSKWHFWTFWKAGFRYTNRFMHTTKIPNTQETKIPTTRVALSKWQFFECFGRQVPDTPVDLSPQRKFQIHGWLYLNNTSFGYFGRQVPDTPVDLFPFNIRISNLSMQYGSKILKQLRKHNVLMFLSEIQKIVKHVYKLSQQAVSMQ